MSGTSYDRSGDEMRGAGLYVDLGPWQYHLFRVNLTEVPMGAAHEAPTALEPTIES